MPVTLVQSRARPQPAPPPALLDDSPAAAAAGAIPGADVRPRCHGGLAACHGQVWAAEHDGTVALRDGRTGEVQQRLARAGDGVFVNCIAQVLDAVWTGSSDGTLREWRRGEGGVGLAHELELNQGVGPDEVLCIAPHSAGGAWLGTAGGRVAACGVGLQLGADLRSRGCGVTALAVCGDSLWIGDRQGCVSRALVEHWAAWVDGSPAPPPGQAGLRASSCEVWQLLHVWRSETVWASSRDGSVHAMDARGSGPPVCLARLLPPQGAGRPCSLLAVGGSVLGCGADGTLLAWSARDREFSGRRGGARALGAVDGGARHMCSSGVAEVARVWCSAPDRALRELHVRALEEQADARADGALAALQFCTEAARGLCARARQGEAEARAALGRCESELAVSRSETARALGRITELEGALGILRDRCEAACRERDAAQEDGAERQAASEEQGRRMRELEVEAQGLKSRLLQKDEGIEARDQEVKRAKKVQEEAECSARTLGDQRKALTARVDQLVKDLEKEREGAKAAREDAAQQKRLCADAEKRRDAAQDELKKEKQLVDQLRKAEEAQRRVERDLKQTVDSLEARLRDKHKAAEAARLELDKTRLALSRMEHIAASESQDATRLADSAVLAKNEAELLRRERDELVGQIGLDRTSIDDRDDLVTRLRTQVDALRGELEGERSNNKLLEDQYTIFQFVINSRGELVTSIWSLHDLLKRVRAGMQDVDDFVKQHLRGLRVSARETGGGSLERMRDAVRGLDEKCTYIISNYFTEYEKLHLGIPSYYFFPDTRRPHVGGNELLERLKQVTPAKLYRSGDALSGDRRQGTPGSAVGSPAPPPPLRDSSASGIGTDRWLAPPQPASLSRSRSPGITRALSPPRRA